MSALTVGDVLNRVEVLANFRLTEDLKAFTVTVRGRYKKVGSFPKLFDEDKSIDLILNGNGLSLKEDALIEVTGILLLVFNKNAIYIRLQASEIKVCDETPEDANKDELEEIFKGFNPRLLSVEVKTLLGKLPKVKALLIHGRNAQTQDDFINGMRSVFADYETYVDITKCETPLTDDALENIIKEQAGSYDVIFLVRGGGAKDELKAIGGIKSAKAVRESGKPFYVALGHTHDRGLSYLEMVADEIDYTPSLLGMRLGQILKDHHHLREKLNYIQNIESEYEKRMNELKEKLEREFQADLERRTANFESEIKHLREFNEKLKDDGFKLKDELQKLDEYIRTLKDENYKMKSKYDALSASYEKLKASYDTFRSAAESKVQGDNKTLEELTRKVNSLSRWNKILVGYAVVVSILLLGLLLITNIG